MQFRYILKRKVVAVFVFAFLSAWNAGTGHWIAEASHVRFLWHLRRWRTTVSSSFSYRRDWMVNEPARRTNLRGDSPRASLLGSRASSFYRIGRPEHERRTREKSESRFASWTGLRVDPDFTVFGRYRSPFSSSSSPSLLLSSFLHGDFWEATRFAVDAA